jgi:hypothetical protein
VHESDDDAPNPLLHQMPGGIDDDDKAGVAAFGPV